MRSDLLLTCIAAPLLAVFLLRGKPRRLFSAVLGGMLAAFLCGSISGALRGLVRCDAMTAVLYISPAVEEGLKLALFLLFLFACRLPDRALPEIAVAIGVGFATMESVALQFTASDATVLALFARIFCSALIHVACALMLVVAVRWVRRLALETVSGLLGVYAATVTVHALYNLLVSGELAARVLGYLFPAALIVIWRSRLSAGETKGGADCADV